MEAAHRTRYRPTLAQGQMFWLGDDAVAFAEQRGRVPHESSRCCIIVEGAASLARADSETVFVVPTSSGVDIKGPYDILLPHPPSPKCDVMVRIQHAQLILRDDLGDYVQQLKPPVVDEIMAALAAYLDLI